MVLCPVAIAVGCKKCPVFSVCPAKGVIGDQKPEAPEEKPAKKRASAGKGKSGKA